MEPYSIYSLRELVLMSNENQRMMWEHTSSIMIASLKAAGDKKIKTNEELIPEVYRR